MGLTITIALFRTLRWGFLFKLGLAEFAFNFWLSEGEVLVLLYERSSHSTSDSIHSDSLPYQMFVAIRIIN